MRFLTSVLFMLLVAQGLSAQNDNPPAKCKGCILEDITYPDGFFLGEAPIPGVTIQWTPDPSSHSGLCNGTSPDCTATPCKWDTGVITVTATVNLVQVTEPVTGAMTIQTVAMGATDYPVGDPNTPAANMACSTHTFTEILDVEVINATGGIDLYHVSVHCTTCA